MYWKRSIVFMTCTYFILYCICLNRFVNICKALSFSSVLPLICLYFTNTLRRMNELTCNIALLAHRCCYVATWGYRRANGEISTQALYWDHFARFTEKLSEQKKFYKLRLYHFHLKQVWDRTVKPYDTFENIRIWQQVQTVKPVKVSLCLT